MKTAAFVALLVLISLPLVEPAVAQNTPPSQQQPTAALWKEVDRKHPAPLGKTSNTSDVYARIQEIELSDYTHKLDYEARVFDWQLASSKAIFYVVLFLVFSGVVFSALQFAVALKRNLPASSGEAEINVKGLKVKSQYLGIITLALSLAFFYLYLKTVYPISYVGEQSAPELSSRPAK